LQNRYDEAMGYLKQAAQLAPGNVRIYAVRDELTHAQALWYNVLGQQQFEYGIKAWNIWIQRSVYN
jgi:hypothetical protein